MRSYKVNGVRHRIFDPEDSIVLPNGSVIISDWKKGNVGDWVKADDECVIQVLPFFRKAVSIHRVQTALIYFG